MENPRKESWGTIIGAVLSGAITTIAVGAILYPVVMVVFDNFFELNFDNSANGITINSLIITGTALLWAFISTLAGGFVIAYISIKKEYQKIAIILTIGLFFLAVYSLEESSLRDLPIMLLSMIFLIAGALTGCALGIKYKTRKERRLSANSNSQPFPPDTPQQ